MQNALGTHACLHHGIEDQELLLRNEYLAAENRIPRTQCKGRLLLSDAKKGYVGLDRPEARTESLGRIGGGLLKYYGREAT